MLASGLMNLTAMDKKTDANKKTQHQSEIKHHTIKRIGHYPISPATQAAINSMRPHIQRKLLRRTSSQKMITKDNKVNGQAL